MKRDNNGDDAIVIIKDPARLNYNWIRNQSSSELQKFRFFFFTWLEKGAKEAWNLQFFKDYRYNIEIVYRNTI